MKQVSHLNVSQFLIEQLAAWGVKRIYGVIGDANLYFLDELAKQNSIRYVACKHECSAALMASAESKLTGQIGVCTATSGPGIANLLNGLADAAMDRTGVLAITGQVETNKIGTNAKQYIDQQKLISPISEQTSLLTSPEALPELLTTSLVEAKLSGKVVHLSIPKDLFRQFVKGEVRPYDSYIHQPLHTPLQIIQAAARAIEAAKKPALLIGRGTKDVSAQIVELAESVGAAVVTTLPAKSYYPNDHALYCGGLGQAGSEAATKALADSDLIVILGATWWPDDYVPNRASIIQIDKTAANIGIGHPVAQGIVGDLADIVPRLLKELNQEQHGRGEWLRSLNEYNREWQHRIEKETVIPNTGGDPMQPQHIMRVLSETVSEDAVIALDTGDHTLWFNRIFQAKQHEILVSGRWRTLGFGLPAAIAAQLEFPERQVLAVVGDGGSVQTLMEFITAVEHQLPIVIIVIDNGSYAMEKNRMELSGLQTLGSMFMNPDFDQIARACGGMGWRAHTAQQFRESLDEAVRERKPSLIQVKCAASIVPHTKI